MLLETRPSIVDTKAEKVEKLFNSRTARERVIRIYEARCSEIPQEADAALVMGTSLELFPDKFKKRIFSGVQLVKIGRVSRVIFSGKCDHETNDTNQALDAKRMAVSEFGLDEEYILTVGGDNTNENLIKAKYLLEEIGAEDAYVVSDGPHLIRTLPLADYQFKKSKVNIHPFPVLNDGEVDPDDPRVIEEIIKAILYNRLLIKNPEPVTSEVQAQIDKIVFHYTQTTRSMPRDSEISFEEWATIVENNARKD